MQRYKRQNILPVDQFYEEDASWGFWGPPNVDLTVRSANENEAERVQEQYEAQAKRALGDASYIVWHLLQETTKVISFKGNYLVGQLLHDGKTFAASHFAPKSRVSGVEFMEVLLLSSIPLAFAVPADRLGSSLERLGFAKVAEGVPQVFRERVVFKSIYVNSAVDGEELKALYC